MKTKSFKIGTVDFKCYKYDYKSVKDFVKEFNIKNYDVLCYTKPNGKLTSKFTFKFGKFGTIDLTSCTWLVISSDDIVYVLKDSEVDNLDIFTETIAWIDNEIRENTKNYKKDKDKLNSSISSEINKLIGDKPKTDNSLFNYSTTTTQVVDKTINDELNNLKKENETLRKELNFYKNYINSNVSTNENNTESKEKISNLLKETVKEFEDLKDLKTKIQDFDNDQLSLFEKD